MSELLWIAVPGGVREGGKVLRVLVVPKLDGGTLGASGMGTWPPASLLGADLAIDWRAGESSPVQERTVPSADVTFEVQTGLWASFLDPETAVGANGRRVMHPQPDVRPTSTHATRIDETYAAPASTAISKDDVELPVGYERSVLTGLGGWKDVAPPPPAPPARPAVAPAPPGFDRVISYLREHPAVLRSLGLIFELRVTPPDALAAAGQVRVRWPGADASETLPAIVSPWTHYGRSFLPFSPDGTISAGMVTLSPDPAAAPPPAGQSRWKIVTVDVEGAARRLHDAARIVTDAAGAEPSVVDPRLPVSLPALRTAGIQLVRVDRHDVFAKRRNAARERDGRVSLEDVVLDADDLVLGYRIDIKRDGDDTWRSLHERKATYKVGAAVVGEANAVEEGHVKVHGMVREGETLRTDEVVARWDGWSLSVVRPPLGRGGVAEPPRASASRFEFSFAPADAALPALRFAGKYELRARVVDMAGGGLAHDDRAADRCALTEIAYRRYEPVVAPAVMLPAGLQPGALGPAEALDHVVVRSAPGVSVDEFAASNPGYQTHASRLLHRPSTSFEMAEQHRVLDGLDDEQVTALLRRALEAATETPGAASGEGPLPDPAAGGVQVTPQPGPGAPAGAASDHRAWPPWPGSKPPKALELRDRAPGEAPVKFDGDTLVVRLRPAEEITLALSSRMTEDFLDHFALQAGMPEVSKEAAEFGRHPMLTPACALTLVHAVRRQVDDPAGEITTEREPDQTFAILDPHPAMLGVDSQVSAQLDITATWQDRIDRDDGTEPDDVVTTTRVQSVVVERGDTRLRDVLRHEFGDTRYREVTYTLSAVGRFRQFFKTGEDPRAFVAETVLGETTTVPSTARPAPPVVLSTRPAFVWRETTENGPGGTTIRRQRLGGHLRVELARPWLQTGVGERLGVVLWDRQSGLVPPDGVRGLVTQVGRDPIWETTDAERWPTEEAFGGTLRGLPERLAETGLKVLVMAYHPFFHNDRWYADIALPGVAASSYCPFVQLALARYQPESLRDLALSPVVRSEMVQVLPARTLTIRREDAKLFVVLEGLGPGAPRQNRVDVVVERCETPAGMQAEAVDLTAFAPPGAGLPAWVPVPGGTGQTVLNSDEIGLDLPPDLAPLRVRVREIELIGADVGAPPRHTATPGELAERVSFTDTVPIPGTM